MFEPVASLPCHSAGEHWFFALMGLAVAASLVWALIEESRKQGGG
jgi:hypothetical protein